VTEKTLSKEQARAYDDRFGAKQDSQGYYEDPATEDMVSHGALPVALQSYNETLE